MPDPRRPIWLGEQQHRDLAAALDVVLPPDALTPGAGQAGGADYVDGLLGAFTRDPPRVWAGGPFSGRHGGGAGFEHFLELGPWEALAWRTRIEGWQAVYVRGLAALGDGFADADDAGRAERLAATDAEFRALLFEHACESLYGDPVYGGNRDGAAWAAIDFRGDSQPLGYTDAEVTDPVTDLDADVVVIGSGPGGATAAHVLSEAGWSVIVLEKGRNHLLELDPPYGPLGHFSNDELKFTRRHLLGPDPWLEPRSFRRTQDDGDRLMVGEVNNLPSTVGGGGVHADGKLPRFREEDFHLRSALGPVDGADVRDWPLEYSDLEPYYAAAERLVGVAGEPTNPFAAWRSGPYPMPPGADMYGTTLSVPAAERHGLHPYRAPTGVNSVPYDGRPACNNCGFCGFHGCPIEAKGDPVALLRRALNTGRCRIVPEAMAVGITRDASGTTATGVRYLDLSAGPTAGDPPVRELRSSHVVLAGGAFETPRLLLRDDLGNSSGMVGRNLMFHFQTLTVGAFPHRMWGAGRGRAVTHLHDDHIVGDDAQRAAATAAGLPWLRGGIVEHGGAAGPVQEALIYGPGSHHPAAMRDSSLRERLWVFTMQGEDLARPENRVDLDPSVRDAWGGPAGRVTWSPHRHELATSAHVGPILESVLRDAGAEWTVTSSSPPLGDDADMSPLGLAPASRHVIGTARMGDDPTTSVVDPSSRLWDMDNVLICDSSVFPTSTGYGPTLTLVALAARAATLLAG